MNNTVNADMNEYWNGDGGHKLLRFQDNMNESLKPFGHAAMASASFSTGEKVIDIGCGCGDTTFEIARTVGAAGLARGIDISTPILAQARERASQTAKTNVDFECADAQIHHFEPSAFDVVFSRFGVMFFDDPVVAFKNLRSALKPGGRVAFISWQTAKNNEWISLSLDVVAKHVPLPAPPDPEEPGPLSFGDPERVKRILVGAGFSGIKIEAVSTPLIVGENLDYAARFLTQMGPASGRGRTGRDRLRRARRKQAAALSPSD